MENKLSSSDDETEDTDSNTEESKDEKIEERLDLCDNMVTSSIKTELPSALRQAPSFFNLYELADKGITKEVVIAEKQEKSLVVYESVGEEESIKEKELKTLSEESIVVEKERKETVYSKKSIITHLKPRWRSITRRVTPIIPPRKYIINYTDEMLSHDDRQCYPYFNYLKKMLGNGLVKGTARMDTDKDSCPFEY